ncbi:MAG: DNA replication/repair protein RecF [Candidatus Paracaedimonas acanthamoebae]|uniref:DNA replication and repair protein RecF n=1 Tax=Candidatus Paracaedimonas acanthamoebae TaxID=244581 RepID=A0A8J7PQD7_9PROT|nr:DNA replication/repair protein RecF [Candidatus Paracaedimonas acanthamoebae]
MTFLSEASSPQPFLECSLSRIRLKDFRCYTEAELSCDARPVVLTGPNGAGKTNILEAISFLSPGRGLRRATLSEVSRHRESGHSWGISTTVEGPNFSHEISTGIEIGQESERRVLKIDHEIVRSQANLTEYLNIIWLTPQMDRIFQEASSARRRFLDRLIYSLDAEHARRLARYEHYLRERARVLKLGVRDPHWLSTLEQNMGASGVAVAASRKNFVEMFSQSQSWALGTFPRPLLHIQGQVEEWLETEPALAVEERLTHHLALSRERDAEAGGASEGPHKTDLKVYFKTQERPADQCSTGEQKALLLAIILATARLKAYSDQRRPIILLDEVVAHLDEGRRQALFTEILALNMQAWMTGTDPSVFLSMSTKFQHFHIENAIIHPMN